MPIPLIIGAGALAASGFGITKGAKGVSQLSDASATIERAQRRLDKKRKALSNFRIMYRARNLSVLMSSIPLKR